MKRRVLVSCLAVAVVAVGCGSGKRVVRAEPVAPASPPASVQPPVVDAPRVGAKPSAAPTDPSTVRVEPTKPGVSPRSPRPSAYERPSRPPAEESRALKYTAGGTTLEVAGACMVTEDSVRCWDARGAAAPDIRERVEKALLDTRFGMNQAIRMRYKAKNRLVVMRTTRTSDSNRSYMMVEGIGDPSADGGGGGSLMMEEEYTSAREPGQPRYQGYFVSAKPANKSVSARVRLTDQSLVTERLAAKVGAALSVDGVSIKIRAIRKASEEDMRSSGMPRAQGVSWTVEVEVKQGTSRPAQFNLTPLDKQGQSIQHVDAKGVPQDQASFQAEMDAQMRSGKPFFGYRSTAMQSMWNSSGQVLYSLSVKPDFVHSFAVGVSRSRSIDITGILLDPK